MVVTGGTGYDGEAPACAPPAFDGRHLSDSLASQSQGRG